MYLYFIGSRGDLIPLKNQCGIIIMSFYRVSFNWAKTKHGPPKIGLGPILMSTPSVKVFIILLASTSQMLEAETNGLDVELAFKKLESWLTMK